MGMQLIDQERMSNPPVDVPRIEASAGESGTIAVI